jgi:hypothetical protein
MRCRLWPATTQQPKTVATFDVLRHFEKMNALGHINATDYYRALAHLTDAKHQVALSVSSHRFISSSCPDFLSGSRGRVSRPCTSVDARQAAEAVRALPETWWSTSNRRWRARVCMLVMPYPRDQPARELGATSEPVSLLDGYLFVLLISLFRWLYRLFLALDANFRLSNRASKGRADDPPLQPGSAFMINPRVVADYVKNFIDEKEVRHSHYPHRVQSSCKYLRYRHAQVLQRSCWQT